LEYIEKEIKRIEGTIKELQEKSDKVRSEVGSLQQQLQMDQQQGVSGQGGGK
jgi:prefoldin beta subunit